MPAAEPSIMTTALYQTSRIKRARATKAEVEERRKARWRRTSTSPSGVTPEQIAEWNLPTRPTKASDSRSKGFGNISVELDAIDPNALRALVQETIKQHLPPDQFAVLKAAEQSEREIITRLVGRGTS